MALLLDHQGARRRRATATAPRLFGDGAPAAPAPQLRAVPDAPVAAGGQTLDDLLTSTWDGLTAGVTAACPVCDGELVPRWSAGAGIVGGRCGDCGSELS